MREYLVHIHEPLSAGQRTALEERFPATRRALRPQFLFLGCDGGPRALVDYARGLGLRLRLVDL